MAYKIDNVNLEFIETAWKSLPLNIFFKNCNLEYVFCTHYWEHLDGFENEDFSINGKIDLEIRKNKWNARKAYKEDEKIIETGKGTSYVIS